MERVKDLLAFLLIRGRLHCSISPLIGLKRGCVVLMYHRILPARDPLQPSVSFDDFLSDVDFIARYFTLVPLSAIAACPPRGAVAITIDDGYREIYDLIYPLVKERGIPVTTFVVSDLVETDRMLWTTELAGMIRDAHDDSIELETMRSSYCLRSIEEKRACMDSVKRFVKSAPPRDGGRVLDEIREKLGAPSREVRTMLSWDEIAEMIESGMEFGSHTRSHAILSKLDSEEAWDEISGSKTVMESRLGREIVSFCYPNGQEGDFTDETIAMVRDAGYSLAVTSIAGGNIPSGDRYALRRLWTEGCSRENLYARIYRSFLSPRGG